MSDDKLVNSTDKKLVWKNFVYEGVIKQNNLILTLIKDSWLRCLKYGLNPDSGKAQNILEQSSISLLLDKNRELIDIAKPFMFNLYQFFSNSGFIVILTDANGYVLERFGDLNSMEEARKINFIPGARWQEKDVGTNAISIAISSKTPAQVSGAQHYCFSHHGWTCSASPIYGPDGTIIAFLDLSGHVQAAYSHTLAMVVAAANAISMQFSINKKNNELLMISKKMSRVFNSISDGVILFDHLGMIKEINPAVSRILKRAEYELLNEQVKNVFKANWRKIQQSLDFANGSAEIEVALPGKENSGFCKIISEMFLDNNGSVAGGIIILRPKEKIYKSAGLANKAPLTLKFKDIIGKSPQILESIKQAKLAAATLFNVILQGESGTGKEIFAQAIHNDGLRQNGPFIALNCGAMPRELVASELFGYEEGAFTGAKRGGQIGKFQLASGGTLFLDEIGEMPLEQQVTLLRVLQEKKVTPIGSTKDVIVDVRIICATNKDLKKLIQTGAFREDLYYRLNVLKIEIPPVRNRKEDIEYLFSYFIDQIGREVNAKYLIEEITFQYLKNYEWPGNVRQIHNVAQRATAMSENFVISSDCLPDEFHITRENKFCPANVNIDIRKEISEKESLQIKKLLDFQKGNISKVAEELGIARSTLYRKMKKYELF